MQRRQFLAGGTALLAVAVAGCGHPYAVLDMREATADDVADAGSTAADLWSEEHTVVTSARENGSATREGDRLFDRPGTFRVEDTGVVRIDDTYYDVSETALERPEEPVYEVHVEFDLDDSTPVLGAIEYDDLPDVDRERLDPIVSGEKPFGGPSIDSVVEYGTVEEVGNESVFVPDRQYDVVVYDGDQYRVDVGVASESEAEFRYEVTEITSDVDAFADRVRERYLFALDGLSDAERAVVEEAIDGAYLEDDAAFRAVTDRIQDREAIYVDDYEKRWLVEYESDEYLTEIW